MRLLFATLTLSLLTACAMPPAPDRESDTQRLARECRERGGILAPSGGPLTGRAETDHVCEFRGPPPRQ
jgi:hypothetical protein